ncbi:MAG: GNAT family N-acetyltransferase [Oscillospiraceae bacterium]
MSHTEFHEIQQKDKRRFLPLLLLGDEQEDMILRYLDRGTLYALYEGGGLRAAAVVTAEEGGALELKNLAVLPAYQRQGYGRAMVEFLAETYRGAYRLLLAGTGESPLTLPFYEACGFRFSHRVKDFFLRYDHPIFEGGVQLRDMIYLERPL